MAAEKGATAEAGKGAAAAEEGEKGATAAAKEVASGEMMTLTSEDGEPIEVSRAAARLSVMLRGMIDGDCIIHSNTLPIPTSTLEKVIEYCSKHAAEAPAKSDSDSDSGAAAGSRSRSRSRSVDTAASEEMEKWDRELVDDLSQDALYDLIQAADYLSIDGLLDVTCKKIADMMKGKTPDQIRETFNIKNDFTEEEEEELRREYAWAFGDDQEEPST